jgi:flagellar biosynthetic protein FliR
MPDFLREITSPDRWPTFVLITARLGGLMLTAPLWSMAAMPKSVRAALIVILAVMLLPSTPRTTLPVGLTAAVLVQGVALGAEIISVQMGLSLGQAIAPMPDMPSSPIAQLKSMLAVLIYVAVDGHLRLLAGLAASLHALPPGQAMALDAGGQTAVALLGTLFTSAVSTAAPVMAALLLTNIAVALLSRAVPQLNAMMVAFPLTIGVGLIVIGAAVPVVAMTVGAWMNGLDSSAAGIVGAFQWRP